MVDSIPVVGKKYRAVPNFTFKTDTYKHGKGNQEDSGEVRTGECVYVHPKLRFAVLSFNGVRESFFLRDIQ